MKPLLTGADNALASINGVRVPSNGVIGRHQHPEQLETVFVLAGNCLLTLNDEDFALASGDIVAIPAGLPHALRNSGEKMVELLTIFTPLQAEGLPVD
jgi:quercetin dioxygenase-like cupin family protein